MTARNARYWMVQVEADLVLKDLAEAVMERPPTESTGATLAKERREFEKKNRMALALIKTYAGEKQHGIIASYETAREAWLAIGRRFNTFSAARKVKLEEDFATLKMLPREGAEAYFGRITDLAEELAGAGAPRSEKDLKMRALIGLSREYFGLREVINEWYDDDDKLFVDVMARVLLSEKMHQHAMHHERLTYGVARAHNTEGQQPVRGVRTCYNCQMPGHIARNCPKNKMDNDGNARCRFCGNTGHAEASCYRKQREQATGGIPDGMAMMAHAFPTIEAVENEAFFY